MIAAEDWMQINNSESIFSVDVQRDSSKRSSSNRDAEMATFRRMASNASRYI